jgi:hypothetical protein
MSVVGMSVEMNGMRRNDRNEQEGRTVAMAMRHDPGRTAGDGHAA